MAEVLTTRLKTDNLRVFYNDIQDNDYYVFVSSVATEPGQRVDAVNSIGSKNLFLEKVLFGKKVFNSDIKFMIKLHLWQKDEVYVQYDDQVDLEDKKFYVVVGPNNNDTGDYRVYKCLFNNFDSPSLNAPNFEAQTENQIYRTPDKYVWKHMFAISESDFEAYNAQGYVPITGDFDIDPEANTQSTATGSEISDIFVENPVENAGYPYIDGVIGASPTANELRLRATGGNNISRINGFYVGMSVYVTDPNGPSTLYEITDYEYLSGPDLGKVTVTPDPVAVGTNINWDWSIQPTVKISGDGTGGQAKANVIDGNISSITVLDSGEGYHRIEAEIVDPKYNWDPGTTNSTDVRATLRPVLSPLGGHGYDLIEEMHCKHVLLYAYVTETDNNQIGKTNTFSTIGIVKNPEFTVAQANTANTPDIFDNRIEIGTDDFGYVEQNKIVIQLDGNNENTFEAKVHEVKASANTIYLSEYMGPYQNVANNDISLDTSKKLVNETNQRLTINTPVEDNVKESYYIQRTGYVYFMEDFVAFERTETSREEYKLVLEF